MWSGDFIELFEFYCELFDFIVLVEILNYMVFLFTKANGR